MWLVGSAKLEDNLQRTTVFVYLLQYALDGQYHLAIMADAGSDTNVVIVSIR